MSHTEAENWTAQTINIAGMRFYRPRTVKKMKPVKVNTFWFLPYGTHHVVGDIVRDGKKFVKITYQLMPGIYRAVEYKSHQF